MYCIHCGTKIADNSRFCTNCGKSVESIVSKPQKTAQSSEISPARNPSVQPQPMQEFTESPLRKKTTFKGPSFKRGEEKQSSSKSSSGERVTRAVINKVLSELQDLDLHATSGQGEMSFPASKAQSLFMSFIKKGILILCMLLFLPVRADVFPGGDGFNGLNISYSISGGQVSEVKDRDGFTTTREITGICSNGTITITGNIESNWSPIVNVTVSLSNGEKTDEKKLKLEKTDNSKSYSVSIPVTKSTKSVHFSISVGAAYGNGQSRGLLVSGSLENTGYKPGNTSKNDPEESKTHVTIDSQANSDEDGSDGGGGWLIPPTVLIGGLAGKKLLDKKKKNKDKNSEDDKDEEDKEPSKRYEMRIAKYFDDTLFPGNEAYIYVRIVEIDGKSETTELSLTHRIQASTSSPLEIIEEGMSEDGHYKAVKVRCASQTGAKEGIVTFKLSAAGGSFTNRYHIKVAGRQITFLQKELNLPACAEQKTFSLPFQIDGMDDYTVAELTMSDDTYTVEHQYDPVSKFHYAVITEIDEKPGDPGTKTTHKLSIHIENDMEQWCNAEFPVNRFTMGLSCPDFQYIPCYMEEYESRKHAFKELCKDQTVDVASRIYSDPDYREVTLTPAETKFTLSAYSYDMESKHIICIAPTIKSFRVEAVHSPEEEEIDYKPSTFWEGYENFIPDPLIDFLDDAVKLKEVERKEQASDDDVRTRGEEIRQASGMLELAGGLLQGMGFGMQGIGYTLQHQAETLRGYRTIDEVNQATIDGLGLCLDAKKGYELGLSNEQKLVCYLVCKRGIMNKPTRLKAKIIIEAEAGDQTYKLEKEVLLISQPLRTSYSTYGFMSYQEQESRITEWLKKKSREIAIYYAKPLGGVSLLMDNMLKHYDPRFGYDWQQVRAVVRIYNNYIRGLREDENRTIDDESCLLSSTVDLYIQQAKEYDKELGFWKRMALGVVSLGISEGVFNSIEVMENMKSYVDKGGDSVFVGWCYGSWVPIREYGMGLITNREERERLKDLFAKVKKGLKPAEQAAAEMLEQTAKNVTKKSGQKVLKEGAEEISEKVGKKAAEKSFNLANKAERAVAETNHLAKAAEQGKKRAEEVLATVKRKLPTQYQQRLMKMEQLSLQRGQAKIDAFYKYRDLSRRDPQELRKLVLAIQQDKHAMSILATKDVEPYRWIRSEFNREMEKIYEETDRTTMEFLREWAIHKNLLGDGKIMKLNASKSSSLQKAVGNKITYDRDCTYYILYPNGKTRNISQHIAQHVYEREFYIASTGTHGTPVDWRIFAKRMDQTIVEDTVGKLHPESYGAENLKILLDDAKLSDPLPEPEIVAKAATFKCTEWWEAGERLLRVGTEQADLDGLSFMREGLRQCKKQFENYIVPRNAARSGFIGGNKIPQSMHAAMAIIGDLDVNSGSTQIMQAIEALKIVGYEPKALFSDLGRMFLEIG